MMGAEPKVAVITGASRGIGAALVRAYRDRGYRVVASARSIKPSNDAGILIVPGDIAERKTAELAISEGIARFGRIDSLVNNAGIFIGKPFVQYTQADYAAIVGVNVAGFFHITQLAVAEMEKHGSGHVVQITTSLAEQANARVPAVLAAGIRVNAVALGVIRSSMNPPETYSELDNLHPVGHMGDVSDIVDATFTSNQRAL